MGDIDYILLPICIAFSVGCETILIYAFTKIREMRKYPGIYFLIQSICLIVFECHFVTSLGLANNDIECKIIGAFWISCFLLAWCCNFLISLEVYLKLLRIKPSKRRVLFTLMFLGIFWILNFLLIIFTNHSPISQFHTCSIDKDSAYVLIICTLAGFISISIIIIIILCIKIGKNNPLMQEVLKYHLYVAIVFIISLFPPTVIYIEGLFDPSNFLIKIVTYESALSGVFIFIIRALQAKFISRVFRKSDKILESYGKLNDFMLMAPYVELLQAAEPIKIEVILKILNLFYKNTTTPIKKQSSLIHKIYIDNQEFILNEIEGLKFSKYKVKKMVTNQDLAFSFEIFKNDLDFMARAKISPSNTFSYKTHNNLFILNSLDKTEFKALNSLLLNYLTRSSEKSSYLQPIFGLFKLYTSDQVFYLLITENPKKRMASSQYLKFKFDDSSCLMPQNTLLMKSVTKSKIINTLKQDTKVFMKSFFFSYKLEYIFIEIFNAKYKKSDMTVLENTIGYFYLKFVFNKNNSSIISDCEIRDKFLTKINHFLSQQTLK